MATKNWSTQEVSFWEQHYPSFEATEGNEERADHERFFPRKLLVQLKETVESFRNDLKAWVAKCRGAEQKVEDALESKSTKADFRRALDRLSELFDEMKEKRQAHVTALLSRELDLVPHYWLVFSRSLNIVPQFFELVTTRVLDSYEVRFEKLEATSRLVEIQGQLTELKESHERLKASTRLRQLVSNMEHAFFQTCFAGIETSRSTWTFKHVVYELQQKEQITVGLITDDDDRDLSRLERAHDEEIEALKQGIRKYIDKNIQVACELLFQLSKFKEDGNAVALETLSRRKIDRTLQILSTSAEELRRDTDEDGFQKPRKQRELDQCQARETEKQIRIINQAILIAQQLEVY